MEACAIYNKAKVYFKCAVQTYFSKHVLEGKTQHGDVIKVELGAVWQKKAENQSSCGKNQLYSLVLYRIYNEEFDLNSFEEHTRSVAFIVEGNRKTHENWKGNEYQKHWKTVRCLIIDIDIYKWCNSTKYTVAMVFFLLLTKTATQLDLNNRSLKYFLKNF